MTTPPSTEHYPTSRTGSDDFAGIKRGEIEISAAYVPKRRDIDDEITHRIDRISSTQKILSQLDSNPAFEIEGYESLNRIHKALDSVFASPHIDKTDEISDLLQEMVDNGDIQRLYRDSIMLGYVVRRAYLLGETFDAAPLLYTSVGR